MAGVVGEGTTGVRGASHHIVGGVGAEGSGETGVHGIGDEVGVLGEGVKGVSGVSKVAVGWRAQALPVPAWWGQSTSQIGVVGGSTSGVGSFFTSFSNDAVVAKVRGKGNGVRANTDDGIGVRGEGVVGQANFGAGVPPDRITDQGIAVTGLANTGIDVAGMSTSGAGVFGLSQTGLAGHFKGSVLVADDFTVGQQERRSASPGRYSPAALLHGEPGELVRRFWGKDV